MENEKRVCEKIDSLLNSVGWTLPQLMERFGKYSTEKLNLSDETHQKFSEVYDRIRNKKYRKQEKGRLLENLTAILFQDGCAHLFRCQCNCRTSTNELDLLLTWTEEARNAGFAANYSFIGDSFICECKNYNGKVDVTFIGKFCSLLLLAKSKFGIMIAWDGITARSAWSDSKGLIKKIALKEDIYIIIIDKYDLEKIYKQESNIFSLLHDKYIGLKNEIDYSKYIQTHEAEEKLIEQEDQFS